MKVINQKKKNFVMLMKVKMSWVSESAEITVNVKEKEDVLNLSALVLVIVVMKIYSAMLMKITIN